MNPFEQEADSQLDGMARVNPWEGQPKPGVLSGFGFNEDTAYLGPVYRALEFAGSAAAKGEMVLGGLLHQAGRIYNAVGTPRPVGQELAPIGTAIQQDARERVKAMTPDPATTGAAVQLLHGIGEGTILFGTGLALGGPVGAAGLIGSGEGVNRYQELREQGVSEGAATASGLLSGATAGAGAFLPAGFGSTLLSRLATGAAGNVAFGMANRYLDHKILQTAGYPEIADQQQAWDTSAILADAVLGGAFGALSHLHNKAEIAQRADSAAQDAARTLNLANRDRQSAPGIPVDPTSANAHQAALEKAAQDLQQGKSVDVSETGVDKATFVSRPTDLTDPERIIAQSFKEAGILDEERNLRDLEEALAQRQGGVEQTTVTPREAAPVTDPVAQALA